ncbi:MAG: putative metal-binding motif-containing protein [Myxococcota bacterium]
MSSLSSPTLPARAPSPRSPYGRARVGPFDGVRVALAVSLGLSLSTAAAAQTVTNSRTGLAYGSIGEAIGEAQDDDTLTLAGTTTESFTVDRNLQIVGDPGATIRSGASDIATVEAGVEVTFEGLSFEGTGNTRAILATAGDATLTIRSCTFETGKSDDTDGGAILAQDPAEITVESSTFLGTSGRPLAFQGGAVWVDSVLGASLTFTDVVFSSIESRSNGGAIYTQNVAVTCTRCTFDHTDGAFGGAIFTGDSTLTVIGSAFCHNTGGFGSAVFSSADVVEIRTSVFDQSGADAAEGGALYLNGGNWYVVNNDFLGVEASTLFGVQSLSPTLQFTNNLVLGGETGIDIDFPATLTYNWFDQNTVDAVVALDATNHVGDGDPDLTLWTRDDDCGNDQLWPHPVVSPLLDAGDPSFDDPDGSRSDIGAFGGPDADPYYHTDHDGDGAVFLHDCDDADGANFPGNDEVCDHGDNDCDAVIDEDPIDLDTFWADCDADGQGAGSPVATQCFEPTDPPACGGGWASENALGPDVDGDCDDADPAVNAFADETCAAGDQNCDGDDDRGAVDVSSYFYDRDGDGFGGESYEICADTPPAGSVTSGGDCEDNDEAVYPNAPDACGDGIDQDCNGADGDDSQVSSWYPDLDGDSYGDGTAPPTRDCVEGAGLGYTNDASDCDDADAQVHPGTVETCDGRDEDCNGLVDDRDASQTWYQDGDGDGVGDPAVTIDATCPPDGWVASFGDCDDSDPDRIGDCGSDPLQSSAVDDPKGECSCSSGAGSQAGLVVGWIAAVVACRRRGSRSVTETGPTPPTTATGT